MQQCVIIDMGIKKDRVPSLSQGFSPLWGLRPFIGSMFFNRDVEAAAAFIQTMFHQSQFKT